MEFDAPVIGHLTVDAEVVDQGTRDGWEDHQSDDTEQSLQSQVAVDFEHNGQTRPFEEDHGPAQDDGEQHSEDQVTPERQLRVELDGVFVVGAQVAAWHLGHALRPAVHENWWTLEKFLKELLK